MGTQLKLRSETTFYGEPLPEIEGLVTELRQGVQGGIPYSYLVFLAGTTIKWKIFPRVTRRGGCHTLKLYHRNTWGCQGGFHSQCQWQFGNRKGFRKLVRVIRDHEEWEQAGGRLPWLHRS